MASQIVAARPNMKTEYVPGHVEQEANAKLIAAAPEMFELLKEAATALTYRISSEDAHQIIGEIARLQERLR